MFLENIYSEIISDRIGGRGCHRKKPVKVEKKQVFIALRFQCDHLFSQINRNPKPSIRHMYSAAQSCLPPANKRLSFRNHSSCVADLDVSHVVYQFPFSCGDAYVGKTDRCLTPRLSVHILKCLSKSATQSSVTSYIDAKPPTSWIPKHIVASSHRVDYPIFHSTSVQFELQT